MMGKRSSRHIDIQWFTATVSTALVLLLLGVVMFVALAADNLTDYVRENVNFSLVLGDNLSEKDQQDLVQRLAAEPYVKTAEYVSKEQALEVMKQEMNTDPSEFEGYNPFPALIEVKLRSEYANTDSIALIEARLKTDIKIEEVLYQRGLIDSLNRNMQRLTLLLLGLAVVLLSISFALINNTIRLTVYAKRFLIYTMKLVGASRSFIRRPFMTRYFWVGLCAALCADGVLCGAAWWLLGQEPKLIEVLTPRIIAAVSLAVVLLGVLITLCCAYFSVNKYLKMKANKLYHI